MTPENAIAVMESHVDTWEFEFPATCKVLAAVKNDARDYKPDAKSRTAWELASHLATADMWFIDSIINGSFTWDPDAAKKVETQFRTVDDIVDFYKKTFPAKLAEVRRLPADKLTRTVDFFGMMQWPAVKYLGFATNHSIHHRGQLAAYLRAMGSKVPAIYGGSADEPMVSA
jgi:uncharacterized damage-inducible protein DinB